MAHCNLRLKGRRSQKCIYYTCIDVVFGLSQREPTIAVGEHIGLKKHKITEEVKVHVLEKDPIPVHGGGRSGRQ